MKDQVPRVLYTLTVLAFIVPALTVFSGHGEPNILPEPSP